jgi:hypothetical protein
MFQTVRLSIIRSLFTVHSAMIYVIQVCRQLSSRTRMELRSILVHPSPARKLCVQCLYDIIPLLRVQWINSWWWTDELSETCRISWQNKFVKLVHLVGFITKKFVTMHGHMNVKKSLVSLLQVHDLIIKPVGEAVWRGKLSHVTLLAYTHDNKLLLRPIKWVSRNLTLYSSSLVPL